MTEQEFLKRYNAGDEFSERELRELCYEFPAESEEPERVWGPWCRTSDGVEYATNGKSVKVRVEQYSVNLGKIVRIGHASCSPYDDFDFNTGIRIAFLRAKQKVCEAYQDWIDEKIKEGEEGFIPEFIHYGGSL